MRKNSIRFWLLLTAFVPVMLFAVTTFSVDPANGFWKVSSGSQSLTQITTSLNGKNVLLHAKAAGSGYRQTVDGLEVTSALRVVKDQWTELSVSVHNPTADTLYITSFEPLTAGCDMALQGTRSQDLNIMWESATYDMGRAKDHESAYYCALYSDKDKSGPAWMLTYRPPQLWTSMIKKEGDKLTAFVNFHGRKFPVDPGETITFDPLMLSAQFNTMEGWQAIGKLYKPAMPVAKAAQHSGFNTWDFFRGQISAKDLQPVLADLKSFNAENKTPLRYFTLDDGWFSQRGSWEFDENKFPGGERGWNKTVRDAGMIPGVWIAPFWSNKERVDEFGMNVLEEVPDHVIRYRVDPSDPNVRRYVIERFRKLSQAGYKYFKIDFLALAYTDRPFKYSKFPPERVLREFIQEIRNAIGKDAFLLGCSTVIAPCAMICDGARIMSDITENWNVTKEIYRHIAYRYWMNGNLFITDPDFFVGRGYETLKQDASPGIGLETGDRQYEGFDYAKAKTWATMCFALGGHFNWSDQPSGVKQEIWNLAATLAQYGPGAPGVPLDLMDTEYPTKWVRTNNGQKYLALINVSDQPVIVRVTEKEMKELHGAISLSDIFSHEQIRHQGGDLEVNLNAYESKCLVVDNKK